MALAYSYFRQEMYEEAATLYAELAEAALTSSLMSKEPPVIEPIRLHSGTEENKDALRKFRGEDDEDFQITEYQAPRGNAAAMYKLGLLYYYGLRGLRCDYAKSFHWFSKAVEKGESRSMELLGEIYAGGARVDRNYTEAYKWLTLAAKQQHYSAYNGLGYLYVKGYRVEKKNLTKARELFELAVENKEPGGYYNLGVLYLKGIGVKRDVIGACNLFLHAVNAGQPKLFIRWRSCSRKALALREIAEARLPMVASDRAPSIKRQDSFEMKLSDLQKIDNPLHRQSSKNSDPESPISLLLTSDPKNEGSHPKTFSGLLLYLIVFMLMSGQRSSRQTLHHFGCLLSSVLQNIFMLC